MIIIVFSFLVQAIIWIFVIAVIYNLFISKKHTDDNLQKASEPSESAPAEVNENRADPEVLEAHLNSWHFDKEYNMRNMGDAENAEADTMLDNLLEQAQAGDPEKMQLLGEAYRTAALGLVEQDIDESFKWYYKAANLGNAESIYWVAYYFCNGFGVDISYNISFKLAQRAVELVERPRNLRFLGLFYEIGMVDAINLNEAENCWLRALQAENYEDPTDEDNAALTVCAKKLAELYNTPDFSGYDTEKSRKYTAIYNNYTEKFGFNN